MTGLDPVIHSGRCDRSGGGGREKAARDPTNREKFNTCRFADYKDKVIDLLMRVTRVSVETMEIVAAMRDARR